MSVGDSDRLKSISARVVNTAQERRQDPNRVRRQVAFHRLIARMAGSGWVLKGGYCLELRLPTQARTTKDVDLVCREVVRDADALLDELDLILSHDAPDDGFVFEALSAKALRESDAPHAAWRVTVAARVDGRLFENVVLDVVTQFDEVAEAVEELDVPSPVPGLGHQTARVLAVDVYQHAAEKFHAMARVYADERPSSRVKDLVDLALLLEAGLLTDLPALRRRLWHVHQLRDGGAPPRDLPRPPRDWDDRYAHLVAGLDLSLTTCDVAFAHVHDLYRAALAAQD